LRSLDACPTHIVVSLAARATNGGIGTTRGC
jgi:hypothetical protein